MLSSAFLQETFPLSWILSVGLDGHNTIDSTLFNPSDITASYLFIGRHGSDTAQLARYLKGDIAEIVVYGSNHNFGTDKQKIESYLALKYGITLDNNRSSASVNYEYLSSDGTLIWPGTSLPSYRAYHHGVAGIGRDNDIGGSEFQQKQSMSSESGSVLIMGLDTIVADNASNTASFDDNFDFLVWGHNDSSAAQSDVDSTDVPSGVSKRMDRIWRVRNTGNVGAVDVHFVLTGLGYGTPALTDFKLIVSNTSNMADGITVAASAFVNDTVKFDNVTFTNGRFFSLGVEVPFNRLLWLKADMGTTFQGTNDTLSAWLDQTMNGYNPTISKGPYLSGNLINFNPAIYFDEDSSALVHLNDYASDILTKDNTFFIVSDVSDAATDLDILFYGSDNVGGNYNGLGTNNFQQLEFHIHRSAGHVSQIFLQDSIFNSGIQSSSAPNEDITMLNSAFYKAGDSVGIASNGNAYSVNNTVSSATNAANHLNIGGNQGLAARFFDGDIAEIIVYNKHDLPQSERDKVESYLALKYGITLDQNLGSSTENYDYLSSDNTTIWPGTSDAGYQSYHHGIAGIGRDDESTLYQKQSRADGANTVLTVGLGVVAASNAANTNTLDDQDFFVWGHDDGSVNSASAETSDVPVTASERMARTWRVKNTGDVRNLELAFDLTGLGYTMTQTNFQLIVSGSATMANGWTYSADSISGNVVYFKNRNQNGADLGDGQYFTLGTQKASNGSPGGVSTGLLLWLKANLGIIGDPLNVWVDISENNYHATNFTGSGRPTVSSDSVNFNPGVNFDDASSGQYLELDTYVDSIMLKDNTFFIVSSNVKEADPDILLYSSSSSGGRNGFGNDGSNLFEFHLHRNAGLSSGIYIQDSSSIDNQVNFNSSLALPQNTPFITSNFYKAGDSVGLAGNGDPFLTETTVHGDNVSPSHLFIGKHFDANENRYLDGDITEIIAYNTHNLSQSDRNKIESYLAIKYGVTLDENRASSSTNFDYVSSSGTTIWPGTTDASYQPYHHDVAGIGRDDPSGLLQLQSKSANDDSGTGDTTYVTIATTSLENGRFLVWGNDGAAMENENNTEFDNVSVSARLNREWRVEQIGVLANLSVTFDVSTVSGPSGVGSSDLNQMRLMLDADGDFSTGASYYSPTSTDAVNKTVTFSNVDFTSDGEYFTLGSTEEGSLPIKLISFDATVTNENEVNLTWSTAQEINNSFFTIERSKDGRAFEEIAFLDGAGNSNEILDYHYLDREPLIGKSYYRLKQTDFNGQFAYSGIEKVEVYAEGSFEMKLSPNPTHPGAKLDVLYKAGTDGDINLVIYSYTGATLLERTVSVRTGDNSIEVNTDVFGSSGIYFVRVSDRKGGKDITIVKKVVVY